MRQADELYRLTPLADEVPAGLPLVAGLSGFVDAGGAVAQLATYAESTLEPRVVAEFESDLLLDYRARRPVIEFDQDHITAYRAPQLHLSLATDELGRPLLTLMGYEPDFRWEQFVAAVLELVDRFQVASVSWVHGIPMPVPHTRPIQVTVGGNRRDLIDALSVWRPTTHAPANVLHLLEHELVQRGDPVVEFVLLVPHYLADTEVPAAAMRSLEVLAAATGRIFATDALRDESRDFTARVDEQVAQNEELQSLVHTLEERHDEYMAGNPVRSPLIDVDGGIPSGSELADELEKFLAFRRRGDDDLG